MKKYLLFFFLFIFSITNAQVKACIINSNDKSPVPYVNIWIENENIGTTSNTDGIFEITEDTTNKNIIFSALSYETLTIPANEIKDFVTLVNNVEELDEVLLIKRKKNESITIGEFKKKKVNSYFSCGITPWITARYFPYKDEYTKTPYLNQLEFITSTFFDKKKGKVNIRLYNVSEDGFPGDYLSEENIIVNIEKGKKITTVKFNVLDIIFPKSGLFIAVEWLIIDDNYYETEMSVKGKIKKQLRKGYNPSIGTVPFESNEFSFIYRQGKWEKVWLNKFTGMKAYKNKYQTLAMKLHLSN